MSFRSVFVALVIATGLIVGAFVLNSYRPKFITDQPSPALIKASGKCAECHSNQEYSLVHEYELSKHAQHQINCLACHQPEAHQEGQPHHGFTITTKVTAANCRSCHESQYQQFLRSRHAAPAWGAVLGGKDFSPEQISFSERYHAGAVNRPPHPLVSLEGDPATGAGCVRCHSVGRPKSDGTIGTCTACHARHTSSVEMARLPTTCGQCHMGPDHSQLEIYLESKHGVLFQAQESLLNLKASPAHLTTRDMFVPTCATCHMSGLNKLKVTHDTSERLSYLLASEVTTKRKDFAEARIRMQELCLNCHTKATVERVYSEGDRVVETTNLKVKEARAIIERLRKEGLLSSKPFQTQIDFAYFDLWHYYGRTAKHGAFMGGADFVQWHGNYPLLKSTVELKAMAEEMRRHHAKKP